MMPLERYEYWITPCKMIVQDAFSLKLLIFKKGKLQEERTLRRWT